MQIMGIVVTLRTIVCQLVSSSRSIGRSRHVSIELLVAIGYEHTRRRLLGSQIFKFFIFSSSVSQALLVCGCDNLAHECVRSCRSDGGDVRDGCCFCDGLSLNCEYDLNLNCINVCEKTLRDCVGCVTT